MDYGRDHPRGRGYDRLCDYDRDNSDHAGYSRQTGYQQRFPRSGAGSMILSDRYYR